MASNTWLQITVLYIVNIFFLCICSQKHLKVQNQKILGEETSKSSSCQCEIDWQLVIYPLVEQAPHKAFPSILFFLQYMGSLQIWAQHCSEQISWELGGTYSDKIRDANQLICS